MRVESGGGSVGGGADISGSGGSDNGGVRRVGLGIREGQEWGMGGGEGIEGEE